MTSDYATRLRTAMQARDTTAQQLATKMGVSYQAVRKVMVGQSTAFSAANNAHAARLLRVSSDWLATGEGAMEKTGWETLTDGGGWPFPNLAPAQYVQLTPAQQAAIESWVIQQVLAFSSSAFLTGMGKTRRMA